MSFLEELKDKKKLVLSITLLVFLVLLTNTLTKSTLELSPPSPQVVVDKEVEKQLTEPFIDIASLYNRRMQDIAAELDVEISEKGNIKFENEQYTLLIESSGGDTSSYVQVGIKSLGACSTEKTLGVVEGVVSLVSLDSSKIGEPTNAYNPDIGALEYCDYPSQSFGVGVSCMYDGGYYDVSLSPRKYCSGS